MVLRPFNLLELKEIFDNTSIEVIKYFIQKSVFSQPERIPGQEHLPIQVPKEHIEQWVVQAIGAKPVGAGSYGVDVIKEGIFGADVKMLSCKIDSLGRVCDCDSGETSLAQNFKDEGTALDELFRKQEYDNIINGWKDIIYNKLDKVRKEQGVEKIYYIFILRTGTSFRLCGMEVNLDELNNIEFSDATSSSVFIKNFIDDKYGKVKIYKAKKRLELRLRPKYWVDHNMTLNFDLNFNSQQIDIRKLVENNKLNEYKEKIVKDVFNNNFKDFDFDFNFGDNIIWK